MTIEYILSKKIVYLDIHLLSTSLALLWCWEFISEQDKDKLLPCWSLILGRRGRRMGDNYISNIISMCDT